MPMNFGEMISLLNILGFLKKCKIRVTIEFTSEGHGEDKTGSRCSRIMPGKQQTLREGSL